RRETKDSKYILLRELPPTEKIYIDYNTVTLHRQLQAIRELQSEPQKHHLPLLKVVQQNRTKRKLENFTTNDVEQWHVLTDETREGVEQQKEFVKKAVSTEDFAILEGPPGSGKTTTILEIISQLVKQGKRILLCASTHVAVDNVIEKLKDTPATKDLLLIRIASDSNNVSDAAQPYLSNMMAETERKSWIKRLSQNKNKDKAIQEIQNELKSHLKTEQGHQEADNLLWSSAQIICGTTMGFLQHPSFKYSNEVFDYLILDEASKTTFPEFLVPALKTKRWIIVGDYKQLSPYVEDDLIKNSIAGVLKESFSEFKESLEEFAIAYLTSQKVLQHEHLHSVFCIEENPQKSKTLTSKIQQLMNKEDVVINLNQVNDEELHILPGAGVLIGSSNSFYRHRSLLPTRVSCTINLDTKRKIPQWLKRQVNYYQKTKLMEVKDTDLKDREDSYLHAWANEISWRLKRIYELRLFENEIKDSEISKKIVSYQKAISSYYTLCNQNIAETEKKLRSTKIVCFPSILESLQRGNGIERDSNHSILSKGLDENELSQRFVRLQYQHRMHPDISNFPAKYIYHRKALKDPKNMANLREMKAGLYNYRKVWIDVKGKEEGRENIQEAKTIIKELERLAEYLQEHYNPFEIKQENYCPKIAILTFHRRQEKLVREYLREFTRQGNKKRYFTIQDETKKDLCQLELCTVDRYQGHEADVVYLTMTKTAGIGFLDNPNRLNVALTRAKYQLVIIGNKYTFLQKGSELLKNLAKESKTIHPT
ncbi:MAG: AAA domain-containing protein, partial [Spirochaetota bacterium]